MNHSWSCRDLFSEHQEAEKQHLKHFNISVSPLNQHNKTCSLKMEEFEEKKVSAKQAERGKETLFRVTYNHQSKLVQIADYKANMIISVSTMVISAIVAVIGYGSVSGAIT